MQDLTAPSLGKEEEGWKAKAEPTKQNQNAWKHVNGYSSHSLLFFFPSFSLFLGGGGEACAAVPTTGSQEEKTPF